MSPNLSRVAARVAPALAGAVFAVPLAGAFLHPDISWAFKTLTGGLLLISAARPIWGVVALVLAVPFATVVSGAVPAVATSAEVSDAFLLAFVTGASLRFVFASPVESDSYLRAPALILVAAVGASLVAELHGLVVIAPRRPIVADVWYHLMNDYWTVPRELPLVHGPIRWMAWLVAATYVEPIVRAAENRAVLFRMWILAGAAGASFAVVRLLTIVLRSELSPIETLASVLPGLRISELHGDVNAAGSFFLLFLVPALIVGWRRRGVYLLGLATPLLMLAFALARSRAAIVAAVLTACAAGAWALFQRHTHADGQRGRRLRRLLLVSAAGVLALAALLMATRQSHVNPLTALGIRWQMTQVGIKAASRDPVFGVGLGDYARMTRRVTTVEDTPLLYYYAPGGENAHNNFLQILVELGLPALVVFLWMVLPIAATGFSAAARSVPELEGLGLGVAAFLGSAAFGHPLLVPQVGTMFFVACGLTAGFAAPPAPGLRNRMLLVGGLFYLTSCAWRLG